MQSAVNVRLGRIVRVPVCIYGIGSKVSQRYAISNCLTANPERRNPAISQLRKLPTEDENTGSIVSQLFRSPVAFILILQVRSNGVIAMKRVFIKALFIAALLIFILLGFVWFNRPAQSDFRINDNKLTITLQENPTTGFRWHFNMDNGGIFKLLNNKYTQEGFGIGAGGEHEWVFRGLSKGTVTLTFKSYREGDNLNTSSIETKIFLVTVGEDGKIEKVR